MAATPTFTGRARRRATRPWVKAGDGIARAVITLGGIGTIVAVLLVAVFLLAVALPLFRPARLTAERGSGDVAGGVVGAGAAGVAAIGADEAGVVAWTLAARTTDSGPQAAELRVVSIADGAPLLVRSATEAGLEAATVVACSSSGQHAVAGFADGSFRVGRLGLESSFLAAEGLPAAVAGLEPGAAGKDGDTIIVRAAGGQFATVAVVADFAGEPSVGLSGRVVDADITMQSDGPLVAVLDATGAVRVETRSSRRNLLTDELVTSVSGGTLQSGGEDFKARFVRLSELGDQLFLFAGDGVARRYEIRDIEAPVLRESFDAAAGSGGVTEVARMFGGNGLAVADAAGVVRVFFPTRAETATAVDGLSMAAAKLFPPLSDAAPVVTALAASPRSRLLAVADASGGLRLLQTTTGATVASLPGGAAEPLGGPASALLVAPRENRLLAAAGGRLAAWALDPGYPEVSWGSLFGPVWYEKYPGPVHAWETTGHESFESKFGLVPLIFGTLKATLYSMLFATPVAILAAIYASQFLPPRWKARIKPTIEMMASLPSVVLGFVAGLVFAPVIEGALMTLLAGFLCVPLVLLAGAYSWQLLPAGWRSRFAAWRFPLIAAVALPTGLVVSRAAAGPIERMLFSGDVAAWLDGRGGSGFGGWVLALVPLAGVGAAMLMGRFVSPWLRRNGRGWSQRQAAFVSLATFAIGIALAAGLAVAAASFLDALRLDTRGGLFGTYVQRNALIVAVGMSFAIIPLIFTIAEDALSSVPDHLRSASLGAGATPWQTAIRVIVPAAASGLFSAVMIGLGRAVGETMIVLMAAGNTPLMDWNLFNGFQTLSAAIATELPEAARGSGHYRVLFLAALTLFAMTFVVNTVAEVVRQRFRRRAHEL
jgi:phosphate transport system permease protein